MIAYIYLLSLVCALLYFMYRDIRMYRKGIYNPYPFRRGKHDLSYVKSILINLAIVLGGKFFVLYDKLNIMLVIFYILTPILILQLTTLNYLSYKKSKDKMIIIQTFIIDLILMGIVILIWKIN